MNNILITGGAGFIGSAVIRYLIKNTDNRIVNIDALTYAGNLESLQEISESDQYSFEKVNICNKNDLDRVFHTYKPDMVMHLAAESHVDRSIHGPADFIETNIVGTFNLLEICLRYFDSLNEDQRKKFRFHHVSTDEIYGDLGDSGDLFTEETSYKPSSPYSASKASSDHLVRAWYRTYGFPIIITNCSNNYGPYQFPEKLIPLMIINALAGKSLPVYGEGNQIRDWLFVDDHASALYKVLTEAEIGSTYNIGGNNEIKNIDVVYNICNLLDEMVSDKPSRIKNFKELITFVKDRPGHDVRYAIDASKIRNDLGWEPEESFETGLMKTVSWYMDNELWTQRVINGTYRDWLKNHYGE